MTAWIVVAWRDMDMPNEGLVKCPYYICRSSKGKKSPTITCDKIYSHLGFNIKNKLEFDSFLERENYVQIFCEDMYETCPYFKKIFEREVKEDEEKREKSDRKSKISGKPGAVCKKSDEKGIRGKAARKRDQ